MLTWVPEVGFSRGAAARRDYHFAMTTLVLTVIGDNRAGLVHALSEAIAQHGGNWHQSHMTELGGKFAGIVEVRVAPDKADALVAALGPLEADGLLDVTVARADNEEDEPATLLTLSLLGQDRPGIVNELSAALAAQRISIDELRTSTRSAPMAGELLFEAEAQLAVPASVSIEDLRSSLELLGNELMVDIDLRV